MDDSGNELLLYDGNGNPSITKTYLLVVISIALSGKRAFRKNYF